ncbi:MAG: hypothetical protein Q4A55_00540 [Aerococcus sp.]|nr:hypothetical protein [Aerococcus sp.]
MTRPTKITTKAEAIEALQLVAGSEAILMGMILYDATKHKKPALLENIQIGQALALYQLTGVINYLKGNTDMKTIAEQLEEAKQLYKSKNTNHPNRDEFLSFIDIIIKNEED